MRWACSVDGSEASCSLEQRLDAVRAAGCDVVMERTLAASDEMTNLAAAVEADRQEAVANVIRLVETAAQIGAAVVRLAPADVGPPGGPSRCRYEDAELWAYDGLVQIAAEAERTGVQVAVTGAAGGFLLSPTEHRRFVDLVNSAWVGACVDLARVSAIGDPTDWLETLGSRILVTVADATCVAPTVLGRLADDALVVLTGSPESVAAFIAAAEKEVADAG